MTAEAVQILFFARLGDDLGAREEALPLPDHVTTVAELRDHLVERGGRWRALDDERLRYAVNHAIARADTPVTAGDEVAFFPPVTGG